MAKDYGYSDLGDLVRGYGSNYNNDLGDNSKGDNFAKGSLYEGIYSNFKENNLDKIIIKEDYNNKIINKEYNTKIKENIEEKIVNKYSNINTYIKKDLENKIYIPEIDKKYKEIKLPGSLEELLETYGDLGIAPSKVPSEQPVQQPVRPAIIVPGDGSDLAAVHAIFGPAAQLVHLEAADNDAKNGGQRLVVAANGELLQSYMKMFNWQEHSGDELCYRREALLLPRLEELGCDTPEVFGSFELDRTGRIAMRCYDAETFEDTLSRLGREEKIAYLKRIVSGLVKMQHLVKNHSSEIISDIGALHMDQATEQYFLDQIFKASERITGRKVSDKRELAHAYLLASKRLGRAERYPVHQDFTPRNVLLTKEDDIVITDAEFMSIPGMLATGGPVTLDYSTLMIWPGVELDEMAQIDVDRHFVREWNKYGNPITMNEFYRSKEDTDLLAAKRFAGVYAMLFNKNPTQKNYDRHEYFMRKVGDYTDKTAGVQLLAA